MIRTEATGEPAMEAMIALLRDAGNTLVRVEKDVQGFIGNRLQHALWREAFSLVERGICDAASVDTVVKSCFGRSRGLGGRGAAGHEERRGLSRLKRARGKGLARKGGATSPRT